MPVSPNNLQSPNESRVRRDQTGRRSASVLLEKLRTPSIEARIDGTTGPFIEVGAVPSNPRGDSLIDLGIITKRLVTSNIYQPETIETGYRHRITGERKRISHRDDAPSSRFWRPTGAEFKMVQSGDDWGAQIKDRIDFIGDATNLPVQDGSVGALYASGLHPSAEVQFVSDEAPRTLEPGGVLVLDGAKAESLAADNPYLDTIKMETHTVGGHTFANYAAVRNDLPYLPPESENRSN